MITEVLQRIEQRLFALGLSASAASVRAGLNRDAIRNIKRTPGERLSLRPRTLAALAKGLQTTPERLLTGKEDTGELIAGGAPGAADLPFVDLTEAHAYIDPDRALEGATRLNDPIWPRGTFATRMPDDSMNRIAPAGAYIIVDRTERLGSKGLIYLGVIGDQGMIRGWLSHP